MLQNPSQASALARPASMTASALAADRDPGARAPEQGFAHLLQDSQRRSAIDSPAPQPAVAKAAPSAAHDAPLPAHEMSRPTHGSEADTASASSSDGQDGADAAADGQAADAASSVATDASPSKDKVRARTAPSRTPARSAEKAAPSTSAGPDAEAEADEPKARGPASASTDVTPTPLPVSAPTGLEAVLAQWQAASRKTATGEADTARADASDTSATTSGSNRLSSRAEAAVEAALAKPDLDPSARADLGASISTAAFGRADEAAALTARPGFEKLLGRSLEAIAGPGAAASGAAAYSPTVETAATPTVNVPAPIDSPEFAPALAMQVSLLASDGVKQAELHLNPAEMGPVSVQISLDGTQAHVSFGADLAATRQAIEAGLPDLAGALREAGFTLAGGGVSEHAGGQRQPGSDSGASPGGHRDRDTNGPAPIVATLRHATRAGGIDLYA